VVFTGYSGSSTNKIDRHDITKILLKVALITITPNLQPLVMFKQYDKRLSVTVTCGRSMAISTNKTDWQNIQM